MKNNKTFGEIAKAMGLIMLVNFIKQLKNPKIILKLNLH